MKQLIKLVPVLALATMVTACNDRYQEGFAAGRTEGLTAGRADGERDGYARGEAFFSERVTYEQGFDDGHETGYSVGHAEGYANGNRVGRDEGFAQAMADGTYDRAFDIGEAEGLIDGRADGRVVGRSDGYDDGYDDGYASIRVQIDRAYDDGYSDGYRSGYSSGDLDGRIDGRQDGDADGRADGFDDGYDDGYADGYADGDYDGYDDGYDDGYYDGYADGDDDYNAGFSSRRITAQSASGKANLLSKVHNDLIDYSKIRPLRRTTRGLESNGRLVFEESSMGSKDLEKRAAAVERYVTGEVAKQIKSRFGLSAERSLQIARVSGLWNKFATSRSVTDADADAYSVALIGVNLKDVERAVKDSLEGRPAALNGLLSTAAQVNGTTPENVSRIMNQIFF